MPDVLYIDDEKDLLDMGKIFLEQSGYLHVDTTPSVTEALDKLKHRQYDGIISDYQMPRMNGIEVLRYIRSHYKDLPFILFTGKGREEVVIEALNSGADFYIQKGGDPKSQFVELEHKIKNAINRRRIHDELRLSQQQMKNLINFLPDATFAIDTNSRVIAWNRTIEEMTGMPKDAILGNTSYAVALSENEKPLLIDLVMNRDKEIQKYYPETVKKGDRYISEIWNPTMNQGNGAHLWLAASPLYDVSGNVIGAIEAIRDITSRKEAEEKLMRTNEDLHAAYEQLTAAEEELRQNYDELTRSEQLLRLTEERYRNVVEDQTEFICRFSPEGKLTFVNGAYCRYFALDKDACIGTHHTVVIPPEDRQLVKQHLAALTPAHPVAVIDHRLIMPSGEIRWQRWSDRAIFDPAGRIIEYQSVGRDITETKRMKSALQESNKKLNLLSSITRHDILNQLMALKGYLVLSENALENPQKISEFIKKEQQIASTIEEQITFTRHYQDMGVKTPLWQNVHASVMTVCAEDGFSKIAIDPQLKSVEIFADPLLKTVFHNLFENAAMHGGNVTRIFVRGQTTPDGFALTIEDDGNGIPLADKEQIFIRGFGRHTGLGLFLAREVLAITGLTINETGEPGQGARFTIQIPKGMYRQTGA